MCSSQNNLLGNKLKLSYSNWYQNEIVLGIFFSVLVHVLYTIQKNAGEIFCTILFLLHLRKKKFHSTLIFCFEKLIYVGIFSFVSLVNQLFFIAENSY